MSHDMDCTVTDFIQDQDLRGKIDIHRYVTPEVGIPTVKDIIDELAKPGRDPRDEFEEFTFASDIEKISDLKPGMKIPGIVTNVTAFGAFVDIGVHQDGLVHISELADKLSIKKVTPSVKPPKRPSPAPSARKKKAPFNNPFADLLKG